MDLTQIIQPGAVDFSPEGTTRFLALFSPRTAGKEAPDRVRALADSPRTAIMRAFELTKTQRALLDSTSDADLANSLEPLFEAMRGGKTARVLSIQTIAAGVAVDELPVRDQQTEEAQRQIVITIGRGRCKITITIDL